MALELLRSVYIPAGDGFVLKTWDTGKVDSMGKTILAYLFGYADQGDPDGVEPIFQGSDFACSPLCAIDSDDCLRHLLGFLTLRPGDTDPEYFENYTETQREFSETDAEEVGLWAEDDGPEFEDLDDEDEDGEDDSWADEVEDSSEEADETPAGDDGADRDDT